MTAFRVRWIFAASLASAGAGFIAAKAGAADAARPNTVFIFSDDHAYQAISAYNDPRKLNNTPHIDRLAKEGMRFDRCLVPNSICGPSRATVLTGKYSHVNGFYNNTKKPVRRFAGDVSKTATGGRLKRDFVAERSVNQNWSPSPSPNFRRIRRSLNT